MSINKYPNSTNNIPIVISTWKHGHKANIAAWDILNNGGYALDAVERGVNVAEFDTEVHTVGYGSYPDREGIITLDASIMDEKGNCGSVTFLQHIKTPISVARKIMENSSHVMLSGDGALKFALNNGFKKEELHTDFSKNAWKDWKNKKINKPVDTHNHDTIGMLAIDKNVDISGACSTGGIAFKAHGRIGDSPIIGAGLFIDNEIGGAAGTGFGEVIMKTVGSFAIVELMRNGYSPQEACAEIIKRTYKKIPTAKDLPVYYIALNKQGEFGAYGIKKGFQYSVSSKKMGNVLTEADALL